MRWLPALAVLLALGGLGARPDGPAVPPGPEAVEVPAGAWDWRPAGTWRRDGREVDPPLRRLTSARPLLVMRHQVGRSDYALCVADGACLAADPGPPDAPQTGLSWHDATAYAAWLADRTGQGWRLPTDAEWQRLAAERFADDALGEAGDPADRWIAAYAREAALRGDADPRLRPLGGWGLNSLGVADLAGNVWEWTTGCAATVALAADGSETARHEHCGVRVAEGRHRAMMVDFVRDPSSGGCATGVPPDHLGVRLVRDP